MHRIRISGHITLINISTFIASSVWSNMGQAFEQIDSGRTTWAATKGRVVYALDKGKWRRLGSGNHVSSGAAGVWLMRGSAIYPRGSYVV